MSGIKRSRENGAINTIDMAKCLILLSQTLETKTNYAKTPSKQDVFECQTCNKKFPSFQALGGHRTSHKRPRTTEGQNTEPKPLRLELSKPKMHECSLCGMEFGSGQALGGHMMKHRAAMFENSRKFSGAVEEGFGPKTTPVLRRTSSSKRVFGVDLNLTPLENDLEILFGKMAPKVDVSLF